MTLQEIIETLHAKVLLNNRGEELTVQRARASDLMSDVLTSVKPGALLLTGLTTAQSIYTAEISDVIVICYVRGKQPPEEIMRLAAQRNLVLLSTEYSMYESCGRLYRQGLNGNAGT
jgi:predicted transcriptional regulator